MTVLRKDTTTLREITKRLTTSYGWMLGDEGVDALLEQMGNVDGPSVAAALDTHINNTSPGRGGRTVGSYPPSSSDLLQHIEAAEVVRRRDDKAADQQEKYHTPPNVSDVVPEKFARAWREALSKGQRRARFRDKELAPYLKRTVGMDFFGDACDSQAWREVGRTLMASWTEHDTDLTLDEAKEVYIAAREYHREQSAGQ